MDDTSDPLPHAPQGLADALGAVRARIKALKAREAALRDALVAARLNGPATGAQFEVTVRRTQRRTLDRDRLPPAILDDPRFWKTSETQTVVTRALRPNQIADPSSAPETEEDFDVFEPF